jgi:hypothetical protein
LTCATAEITEAVLIRDDDAALAMLYDLRGLGARIALDDFGTGYSPLSYLQRFPFETRSRSTAPSSRTSASPTGRPASCRRWSTSPPHAR